METFFMIFLFILTLVFLALWIKEKYGEEDYHTTVGRIDRMLSSIDDKVTQLSGRADAGQPEQGGQDLGGPVTKEFALEALRYHHLTIEDADPEEPDIIHFSCNQINYRLNTSHLPYVSLEAGFRFVLREEDLDLMRKAAEDITYNMFIAKVIVSPKGFYVFQTDYLTDSCLQFRDNLRNYIDILLEAQRRFSELYSKKWEEQKEISKDALQTALLATQTDAAGNKILS